MKDIQKMYHQCLSELASIGIVPEIIREVTVNTRARKRWGQAVKKDGVWSINISHRLLDDELPDDPLRDTMIHEILHCVKGCRGHGKKWAALAARCNDRLGTRIRVSSDYSDLIPTPPSKYGVRCTRCGTTYGRERMSRLVSHPEDYRCRCGGSLRRVW